MKPQVRITSTYIVLLLSLGMRYSPLMKSTLTMIITLDGSGNVTSPSKYNGKVRIKLHLGSPDQTADTFLVDESAHWTTQHRLRGIAYMYVRLAFDADVFPNGIPEITATISGKKVYDPVHQRQHGQITQLYA